jgi:hypothetical protein
MANTTDRPGSDLRGRGELDAKTDTGSGPGHANEARGVAAGDFDREINLRSILWIGVWLAVGTLVTSLLMWWFLRGFQAYDEHHEVKMMPMMAQNPQKTPPGPLLQISPPVDMVEMRAQEDTVLHHAGWVDQPGGTLRVPVDVAIDAIAQRGVAPFPATGAPAVSMTQTPLEARTRQETANPTDNRKPGATVQNTQAPNPAVMKPPAAAKPPGR